MILFRKYDQETKIDKVWYQSSNVFYSECEDKENDLKELKVVFKNGATYLYSQVDVNDYVSFVHGGVDGSNGKALNYFIKKYDCVKLEKTNTQDLLNEMEELKKLEIQKQIEKKDDNEILSPN